MSGNPGVRAVRDAAKGNRVEELVVPDELVKAIREGNCIAFVGAGFSGASRLPGWAALLEAILEAGKEGLESRGEAEVVRDIEDMIKARKFEQAAQALESKCGKELIAEVCGDKLKPPDDMRSLPKEMAERLITLYGIPFSAILTTNFDYFLPGPPAAHESSKPLMRNILRGSPLTLIEQMIREIMMSMPYMEQIIEDDDSFQKEMNDIQEGDDGDESEDAEDNVAAIVQSLVEKDLITEDVATEARALAEAKEFEKAKELLDSKCGEGIVDKVAGELFDAGSDASSEAGDVQDMIPALPVIQLHGTVVPQGGEGAMLDGSPQIKKLFDKYDYRKDPGLAFTQLGYRNLLHGNAYYQSFLASVMATKTILYIGFSFSDAYINELRSQTMMLLQQKSQLTEEEEEEMEDCTDSGKRKEKDPIAYAITINSPKTEMELIKETEGVEFLNYVPGDGGPGFEGVEKWLKAIHQRTNPIFRWARCLRGKKLLLLTRGKAQAFIRMTHVLAKKHFGSNIGTIEYIPPPDEDDESTSSESVAEILKGYGAVDLAIVGWKVNHHPMAKYFLEAMDSLGKSNKNSPVIVFGTSPKRHAHHKKESMRMGAAGYVGNLREAFEEIMHVLEKPSEPEKYEKECVIL
jgi:hypothetical protein